jgi:hypothetical protein
VTQYAFVVLFWLIGSFPWVLLGALAIALWLTFVELRELRPHYLWWMWWFSLVLLLHVFGYLILRGYVAIRRGRSAATG